MYPCVPQKGEKRLFDHMLSRCELDMWLFDLKSNQSIWWNSHRRFIRYLVNKLLVYNHVRTQALSLSYGQPENRMPSTANMQRRHKSNAVRQHAWQYSMLCYTLASPLHKSMHEAKETVPCVKVFVDRRYTTVFYLMPVYRASLVGGRGRPYAASFCVSVA